jgi:AraC-like DNA-binding protein
MKKKPRPEKKSAAKPPTATGGLELKFDDWTNLRANLAFAYEGAVASGFEDSPCRPDFLGAWLMLRGGAEVTQEGRTTRAREGEWLILRQAGGRQHFSEDARILSIRFSVEWPDRKPFYELGLSTTLRAKDFPSLGTAGYRLLTAVRDSSPDTPLDLRLNPISLQAFINIKVRFWAWLGELASALAASRVEPTRTSLKDERVVRALHQLNEVSLELPLNENALAAAAGLQPAQFVRVFRREAGTTPKRYFDERRRDACRRLLAGSDLPVKEIALNLGFLSLSDFSAWFSGREKISPREFRKRHRGQNPPL